MIVRPLSFGPTSAASTSTALSDANCSRVAIDDVEVDSEEAEHLLAALEPLQPRRLDDAAAHALRRARRDDGELGGRGLHLVVAKVLKAWHATLLLQPAPAAAFVAWFEPT